MTSFKIYHHQLLVTSMLPSIAIRVYAGIALMSCLSFPRGPINLHSTIYNLCSAHSYD